MYAFILYNILKNDFPCNKTTTDNSPQTTIITLQIEIIRVYIDN